MLTALLDFVRRARGVGSPPDDPVHRKVKRDMPWLPAADVDCLAREKTERQRTIRRLEFGSTVLVLLGTAACAAVLLLSLA